MALLDFLKHDPPPPAKFPENRVGFAIGDVHGRADLLSQMLETLESRAREEKREGGEPIVVFLGDYVDRGPGSAAVLSILTKERPHGYERHFLKGNHEQAMLAFLNDPLSNRAWVMHGGSETLMSYGVQPPPSIGGDDQVWVDVAEKLHQRLPKDHREFLEALERFIVLGDYAFVHAGIDPSRSMEDQLESDLLWARARFIANKRRFSHRVVHGHTPVEQPYADWRRIGVDTGAYASGVLTAARFEGEEVSFISVTDKGVRRHASPQPSEIVR